MSEFNQQDPLESFLRKSLSDFSDSPPEDTWDGIHQQLPQASLPSNFFHRNKWQIFTTLFFISVIGYQSYFFKKEISSLTEKIETISTTTNEKAYNSKSNLAGNNYKEHETDTELISNETKGSNLNTSDTSKNIKDIQSINKDKVTNISESTSFENFESTNNKSSKPSKKVTASQSISTNNQEVTTDPSNLNANNQNWVTQQLSAAPPHNKNSKNSSSSLRKSALNNTLINPIVLTLPVSAEDRATSAFSKNDNLSLFNYSRLTLKSINSNFSNSKIATPELSLYYPVTSAFEMKIPDIPKGKWSIGFYGNTLRNWASITSVKDENGNNQNEDDDETQLNVPLIVGQSYGGGIQVQRHFSRKWSLLFSLEYREYQSRNRFETILKFEDRSRGSSDDPGPGEPLETEFNFSYQLNTALGSTEISFDAEREADNTIEIDDDVNINNKVSIRHRIQTFAVPILVQRTWKGRKPIYLSAKGGLIVNWMKNYRLTLESFEVNSDLLFLKNTPEIERNSDHDKQTNLSLDYSFGVGLHYDLNSRIGVSLEPRFTGSFLPLVRDGLIRGNQLGLGIGGLVYYNF